MLVYNMTVRISTIIQTSIFTLQNYWRYVAKNQDLGFNEKSSNFTLSLQNLVMTLSIDVLKAPDLTRIYPDHFLL